MADTFFVERNVWVHTNFATSQKIVNLFILTYFFLEIIPLVGPAHEIVFV